MMPRTACRTVTLTVATGATLLALTACSPEGPVYDEPTHPAPTMHSLDAKRAIVDLVDASAEALGGEWEILEHPYRGSCSDATYTRIYGITWTYTLRRTDEGPSGGTRDLPILGSLWEGHGLDVHEMTSGGERPDVGLVGRGDAARSIDYLDSEFGGITIGGESPCALDDAPGHADGDDILPTMTPPYEPVPDAAGPAAGG